MLCEILSFFPRGWWWWTSGTLNIAHKSIHVNNVYKYIVVPYRNKFCLGYIGWGLVDTLNVITGTSFGVLFGTWNLNFYWSLEHYFAGFIINLSFFPFECAIFLSFVFLPPSEAWHLDTFESFCTSLKDFAHVSCAYLVEINEDGCFYWK